MTASLLLLAAAPRVVVSDEALDLWGFVVIFDLRNKYIVHLSNKV